jgi:hypothetical protein
MVRLAAGRRDAGRDDGFLLAVRRTDLSSDGGLALPYLPFAARQIVVGSRSKRALSDSCWLSMNAAAALWTGKATTRRRANVLRSKATSFRIVHTRVTCPEIQSGVATSIGGSTPGDKQWRPLHEEELLLCGRFCSGRTFCMSRCSYRVVQDAGEVDIRAFAEAFRNKRRLGIQKVAGQISEHFRQAPGHNTAQSRWFGFSVRFTPLTSHEHVLLRSETLCEGQ